MLNYYFYIILDVDWENIRSLPAPIVPKFKGDEDTSNFQRAKIYEEGETAEPFFWKSTVGQSIVEVSSIVIFLY